jgi:hypothetical protein
MPFEKLHFERFKVVDLDGQRFVTVAFGENDLKNGKMKFVISLNRIFLIDSREISRYRFSLTQTLEKPMDVQVQIKVIKGEKKYGRLSTCQLSIMLNGTQRVGIC